MMQNKNITQKDSQIKARKRQFDSRWRANIASCFETLLQIIPINKRAIKKQSKAQILDSTKNHLDSLEKTYASLLLEKAESLEASSKFSWCSQQFRELKDQFIAKELNKPRKMIQSGNKMKRYLPASNPVNVDPLLEIKKELFSYDDALVTDSFFQNNQPRKILDYPPADVERNSAEGLHCDEQLAVSDDDVSFSLENTPPKSVNIPEKVTLRPSKRKMKMATPRNMKKRSLMREEEFRKRNEKAINEDLKRSNDVEVDSGDDWKLQSDPWLVSDALMRTTFPHRPPLAPVVITPILDEFEDVGGTYAGRDSPLFNLDLEDGP